MYRLGEALGLIGGRGGSSPAAFGGGAAVAGFASALLLVGLSAGCADAGLGDEFDPPPPPDDDPLVALPAVSTPRVDAPRTTLVRAPSGVRFMDVAADWGIDHVRSFVDRDLLDVTGAGACVVDVDGTPPLDLFFTRRSGDGGSVLYVGRGVGDYVDETAVRGLQETGDAFGCLAVDLEGDGDEDLFVVGHQTLLLFENVDGVFVDVTSERIVVELSPYPIFTAAAAGDVDRDGDLDVVIAGYVEWDPALHPKGSTCRGTIPCNFNPSSHPDIPNVLLVQESDGRLVDVELRLRELRRDDPAIRGICGDDLIAGGLPGCPLGLEELYAPHPSLVIGIADFNQDGYADIFVGNDFGVADQVIARLPGGRYFELGETYGLARNRLGLGLDTMGWASGDIDGDGILDHVRTGFEDEETAVHVSRGRTTLFEDESHTIGVLARRRTFRWAAGLVDHDLDGDLDLLEATGHVYREEHFASGGFRGPVAQPTNLYENDGRPFLVAVDPSPDDALGVPTESRSLNIADLDDDGRPEVILGNVLGPPSILTSVVETEGHWLRVRLVGASRNREAVGARVQVSADFTTVHTRVKKVGEGYGGSGDHRLSFGLPTSEPVGVRVTWPDGTDTELVDVPVDQEITITR